MYINCIIHVLSTIYQIKVITTFCHIRSFRHILNKATDRLPRTFYSKANFVVKLAPAVDVSRVRGKAILNQNYIDIIT